MRSEIDILIPSLIIGGGSTGRRNEGTANEVRGDPGGQRRQ